jgi:hypothetical protein
MIYSSVMRRSSMHRRNVLKILAVVPATLFAQQLPKHPANVTFREGGKTKHYDDIIFDTDIAGSFFLYTKRPTGPPGQDNDFESISVANIKSIETPEGAKKLKPPFTVTVTWKNNEVLKGWTYHWNIRLYEKSLPAPMGTNLSKVTRVVYDE